MAEPPVRAVLTHLLALEVPTEWERWSAHDIASRGFPRRRAMLVTTAVLVLFGVLVVLTEAATESLPPLALLVGASGVAAGPLLAAEARPELMRRSPGVPVNVVVTLVALGMFAALVGMVVITEVTDVDCTEPRPEEVAAVAQLLRPDAAIVRSAIVSDGQVRYLTARITVGLEERVATWLVRVGEDQDPAQGFVGVVGPDAAQLTTGLQPAPASSVAAEGASCV